MKFKVRNYVTGKVEFFDTWGEAEALLREKPNETVGENHLTGDTVYYEETVFLNSSSPTGE